ncbi:hypothetical protein [Marinithermofilum abyssi]|uniref:hypothetical protein n=1 Tax=Marinithermofilum abyssi TaxID=1571185 RepID=UPI00166B2BD1|nr:hypothetical protein [Marinithermofilum abyssi]
MKVEPSLYVEEIHQALQDKGFPCPEREKQEQDFLSQLFASKEGLPYPFPRTNRKKARGGGKKPNSW